MPSMHLYLSHSLFFSSHKALLINLHALRIKYVIRKSMLHVLPISERDYAMLEPSKSYCIYSRSHFSKQHTDFPAMLQQKLDFKQSV